MKHIITPLISPCLRLSPSALLFYSFFNLTGALSALSLLTLLSSAELYASPHAEPGEALHPSAHAPSAPPFEEPAAVLSPTESDSPCGRDAFEPNDKRSKARNVTHALTATREVEAHACARDEDWYTVWLNRGQLVELRVSSEEAHRWPPMRIFAPRKRKPQGVHHRGRGAQSLKVYARRSGRYRLRVRGRGNERARYHLSMRELTP